MSVPGFDRVRKLLTDIYTLLTSWATSTAIVDEIRFLQRKLAGVDSTGATDVNNLMAQLEGALYLTVTDDFGDTSRTPIVQMFHQELVAPTELRTKSWLQEIRLVMRRIELHLLPSDNETLSAGQLTEINGKLEAVRVILAKQLDNPDDSDFIGVLADIRDTLSPGGPVQNISVTGLLDQLIDLTECLVKAANPQCIEPPIGGEFPPPPDECNETYGRLIAIATPTAQAHQLYTNDWQVNVVSGVTQWQSDTSVEGASVLSLVPAAGPSKTLGVYVQFSDAYNPSLGGAGFTLRAQRVNGGAGAPGRPDIDVNTFETCFAPATLYAASSADNAIRIGYGLSMAVDISQPVLAASNVRVLFYDNFVPS